jgi:glycosyltransferase involved in cell wall biosynthesis
MTAASTLVAFAAQPWDLVFQRSQQLLGRLARHHRVLFIEPSVAAAGIPRLERIAGSDNLTVLRPHTPAAVDGYADDALAAVRPLLAALAREELTHGPVIAWFGTPLALPLLPALDVHAVVYDASQGAHAPDGLAASWPEREAALLKAADLVVTAGPTVHEALRRRHDHVVCVPNAVDAAHFAPDRVTKNLDDYLAAEQLQAHILAPRLGYYGVIDRRLDLGLVAALADARPQWHLVMVGPLRGIVEAELPRRDNVHWLGRQPYARLPALVAGWDVCLLPFKAGACTATLNPLQALEYLAAEKPCVSAPLPDVAALHGDAIQAAADADAFVRACEAALAETPEQRAARLAAAALCVARHDWDESARRVQCLLDPLLREPASDAAGSRALLRITDPQAVGVGAPAAAQQAARRPTRSFVEARLPRT